MAGRIPQSFIDELIARADLVEIIGSRVPLKKSGREYKACCPFHNEKTPSFWVSPDKQFYHCFGCGAHGTALGFLMEFDRLSFPEAVEDLAGRLGLEVPREAPRQSPGGGTAGGAGAPNQVEQDAEAAAPLYELLGKIAEHYRVNLSHSAAARAYATQRGLNAETLERFSIGYALESWNDVLRRFGGSAQEQRALLAAGMIIERDGEGERYYDRFRDRLMFPIRDTRGRVLAFGGRVIGAGEPKYLNSPETLLFHKGKELYGLYETRLARQSLKRLLVVEGYMDVVRLHQAGLAWSVATLGTATTGEHLRRAFRLVSEIVFAFDGDRAGRAAAWRALQNVLPEVRAGREVRFLFLPEGEDPDSMVGREGAEKFEARLASALPLSEYLIAHLREDVDISHADGKARFIELARPLLEKVPPGVFRDLLLDRIALGLELPTPRLVTWLGTPAAAALAAAPAAGGSSSGSGQRRTPGGSARVGRGGLITQAIALILHYPQAAARVSVAQNQALAKLDQPGIAVLRELLQQLHDTPGATMAQTLERWRERAEYARLNELAAATPWVPDNESACRELPSAIARLLEGEPRARLDALILKFPYRDVDGSGKA